MLSRLPNRKIQALFGTRQPSPQLLVTHASPSETSIEMLHQAALTHRQKGEKLPVEHKLEWGTALSASCDDLNSLTPTQLSTLLWSVCRLGLTGSSESRLLATYISQTPAALLDHDVTASELSVCLWSMVRLKDLIAHQNSFKSWFKSIISAINLRAYELRSSDITCIATSLVISKEPISPLFCKTLALCAASKLEEMTPSEVSAIISALGKLRAPVPWKVVVVILDHYRSILPRVESEEEAASVVNALTGLCYPDRNTLKNKRKGLLKDLARHSLALIPRCSPRQLVLLVSGFTGLGYYPGVEWMRLHRQCCVQKKLEFNEIERARVRQAYLLLLKMDVPAEAPAVR